MTDDFSSTERLTFEHVKVRNSLLLCLLSLCLKERANFACVCPQITARLLSRFVGLCPCTEILIPFLVSNAYVAC